MQQPLTTKTPKPRLLYLVTQPEWGGAQRYVFDLATSLKDEFEITVATGRIEKSRELLDRLEKAGIKTHVFNNLVREIRLWTDFMAFLEIAMYLNQNNFDIVHCNSSKAGAIGALAANINNIKKIFYTAHGWVFNEPLPFWKKKIYKIIERFTSRSTTNIITLSKIDTEIAALEKIGPMEKFIQIYHGIRPEEIMPRETAVQEINSKFNLNLNIDDAIIGCVANFYKTKGLEYLIAAWQDIAEQVPGAKLIIFGNGQLRSKLESQIKKLKIENSVFLPGQLNQAQKYLKAFNIFVLPSVKEGLPYALLEAMAAKIPIIAARVGGIPEMIENNTGGILISPADPDEISASIIRLIKNPKTAERLASNAWQTFNEKFNFEKMVNQTRALYLK